MRSLRFACFVGILLLLLAAPAAAVVKVKSLCEIHYPSDDRIEWRCEKLKWTDTPEKLFGDRWEDVLRFNRMDRRHFIGGRSIKVPVNLDDIKDFTPLPETYTDAEKNAKFILIDQSESFLGAYEYGKLVFSFPAAIGMEGHRVPNGEFRIDAVDRTHISNMYTIEEIGRRYPMFYGLRFHVEKHPDRWISYFIHGRDVPGYPASHGCVGLYDEEMQKEYYSAYDRKVNRPYYHPLKPPLLEAAKELYLWVVGSRPDSGRFHLIKNGPPVVIVGTPPM